jgi:hypothetical protein
MRKSEKEEGASFGTVLEFDGICALVVEIPKSWESFFLFFSFPFFAPLFKD